MNGRMDQAFAYMRNRQNQTDAAVNEINPRVANKHRSQKSRVEDYNDTNWDNVK
jgi:hypothetical protein